MKLVKKLLVASILATLSAGSAMAADVTGNFQTTATLNSFCSIAVADVNFGVLPLRFVDGLDNQQNADIVTRCSSGVSYTISFVQDLDPNTNAYKGRMHGALQNNTDTIDALIRFADDMGLSQSGVGNGELQTTSMWVYAYPNASTNYGLATPDTYSTVVTANITY